MRPVSYHLTTLQYEAPLIGAGVGERIRTFGLRIIDPLLCRLSYSNMLVTPVRFELNASGLRGRRLNHLD